MRSKFYRDWVAFRLPCCVDICGIDDFTVVAHHAGVGGEGIKADDSTVIPLCWVDHSSIHALNPNGYFADVDDIAKWRLDRIEETQALFMASDPECITHNCHRGIDFEPFFDDGKRLCGDCRRGVDPLRGMNPIKASMTIGPEWEKDESV